GIDEAGIQTNLSTALDAVPSAARTNKWHQARGNLPKWIKRAIEKAKKKKAYLRVLVGHFSDMPPWQGAVRFNEFAQRIEVCDPFPPQVGQVLGGWRELNDPVDVLEASMAAQEAGFEHAGKTIVRDALTIAAHHAPYHPVRAWLNGLPPWDGK